MHADCDMRSNLLLNDCEYGYKKGESFDIKFVNNLGYPLKYRTLIFEIKSDKFYKGVDYHLGLYKKIKHLSFTLFFLSCCRH